MFGIPLLVPANGLVSLFTKNETVQFGDVGAAFYTGNCATLFRGEMHQMEITSCPTMKISTCWNMLDSRCLYWEYGTESNQGTFSICYIITLFSRKGYPSI